MTNTRFPNEMNPDNGEMVLMKYTDLPEELKETYHVKGVDNQAYAMIRDLIEAHDSPVWDFENMNNGMPVTLRERFESFGLMRNGIPAVSLLDYAILYSWAETGGIIRIFYHAKDNKDAIRYATFTGPVTIDFARKMPPFTSTLSIPENHPDLIGAHTFYLGPGRKYLSLRIDMRAALQDGYAELTEFGRAHTYNRTHMKSLTLTVNHSALKNTELQYNANDVTAHGFIQNYTIEASALHPGRNTISLYGEAVVQLEHKYIHSSCALEIDVIYDPGAENSPSPSTAPSPSAAPFPTPAITPAPSAPGYAVFRKW